MTSLVAMREAVHYVEGCPLCELASTEIAHPRATGDVIAVFGDEDMIVFLQPPLQVVAVAPTSHVSDLSHFDASALGGFLAALRRTAVRVRSVFACSGTTITPVSEVLPKAEGHVCFHVIPTIGDTAGLEPLDPMAEAEKLAELLR
jgi:diadenosine tetraphosphate (Ap4A) HIT family hydrolase